MSHTVYLEDLDIEFEIEHPENADEWFAALKSHCDDFAQQHYQLQYEPGQYVDLGDKSRNELAEAVGLAIKEFRQLPEEALTDGWKTQWNNLLDCHLSEIIDNWFDDPHTAQDILAEQDFDSLYEQLDEAMSSIEGPVADVDELFERLKDYTEEELVKLDSSTPMDYIRGNTIPLMFSPDADLTMSGRDDLMFYRDTLSDPNLIRLLTLLRTPGKTLMEDHQVDFTDRDQMKAWDKLLDIEFKYRPVGDGDFLKTVMENTSNYSMAAWIGNVSIDNLMQTNFREAVAIEGGVAGGIDWVNGAGYMDSFEGHVILNISDTPSGEVGYSSKSIFDFMSRTLSATLVPLKEVESKLLPEPTEAAIIHAEDNESDFSHS